MRAELLVADSFVGAEALAPLHHAPLAPTELRRRLKPWERRFARAQSPATLKAVRSDWRVFFAWCERDGVCPLPVSMADLIRFLHDKILTGRRRATLDRYLYTIATVHAAVELPSPTRDSDWPLAWKAIVRQLADLRRNGKTQTGVLRSADIARIQASLGDAPRDLRDAAMMGFASDTLCRESEVAAACLKDLAPDRSIAGAWTYFLGRSKNDAEAIGSYRFVSGETKARIDSWCTAAGIEAGPIFRPQGGRPKRDAQQRPPQLEPAEVGRILKRRAKRARVVAEDGPVSGHSTRVGSAVELIENDASILQVMHAGGWKSSKQAEKYGKKALAGRNAMAGLRAKTRGQETPAAPVDPTANRPEPEPKAR